MQEMGLSAGQQSIDEIDFKAQLSREAAETDRVMGELLHSRSHIPDRLKEAMGYMLLSPGKRIRAAMVRWVCRMLSGHIGRDGQIAAAAVEMVHTYSLIHDDLPAMDNDDLRRGQPSCHKQFNEATAILAGDALLTLAFEALAAETTNPQTAVQMIRMLARAAGPEGMIAGQMADLEGEKTNGTLEQLRSIHISKTGRMFAAAAGLGAIAGGAGEDQIDLLADFGLKIGLVFQIADDLLDILASSEQLGKTAGKDSRQGKLTYPSLVGVQRARQIAEDLTAEALEAIAPFGPQADILRRLAVELLKRKK
jgi:geranylgeranyl pyrophosphate synthase